ncbi:hypothetical protein ACOSQ4_026270 [Xanthoceras sorbifolium]
MVSLSPISSSMLCNSPSFCDSYPLVESNILEQNSTPYTHHVVLLNKVCPQRTDSDREREKEKRERERERYELREVERTACINGNKSYKRERNKKKKKKEKKKEVVGKEGFQEWIGLLPFTNKMMILVFGEGLL